MSFLHKYFGSSSSKKHKISRLSCTIATMRTMTLAVHSLLPYYFVPTFVAQARLPLPLPSSLSVDISMFWWLNDAIYFHPHAFITVFYSMFWFQRILGQFCNILFELGKFSGICGWNSFSKISCLKMFSNCLINIVFTSFFFRLQINLLSVMC